MSAVIEKHATSQYERRSLADVHRRLVQFYGERIVAFVESCGCTVRILRDGETFSHASPAIARHAAAMDEFPVPPAGLFVVKERTAYFRSTSDMTLAHEYAHALDLALGCDDTYLSTTDAQISGAYRATREFVTPYAAVDKSEFFAECVRAYVGANDPYSLWPRVSRRRLEDCSPAMFEIVRDIFTRLNSELI